MWFSPELQRNLWLQLSWGRVLAAPILIGIVVAAMLAAWNPAQSISPICALGFVLLLALWSTAGGGFAGGEVGGGTWSACPACRPGRWCGQAVGVRTDLQADGVVQLQGVARRPADRVGVSGGDFGAAPCWRRRRRWWWRCCCCGPSSAWLTVTMTQIAGAGLRRRGLLGYSAVPLAAEIGTVAVPAECPANQFTSARSPSSPELVATWRLIRAGTLCQPAVNVDAVHAVLHEAMRRATCRGTSSR
jgi:hypothetical protein